MRTLLPRHPNPLPPIFQPEMIARAALYAAEHPSREIWVGCSAAKAILGQKFIGGLLDRYLGRIGYQAQQDERPALRGRPDNLFASLPGDRGAHGDFDAESRRGSAELWLRLHRGKVLL